jgi:hypothetical protein
MNLRETQQALQARILAGDDRIAAAVIDDDRMSATERLGIYEFAYVARLIESLQQTYPAVLHVLGADSFRSLARAYVTESPSRVASIRYYGRTFDDFLERSTPEPANAMLGDLARWEWALTCAFDGADVTDLPLSALADIAPERWPALRLQLAAPLQRVNQNTNAVAWWRFAVQDAPQPESIVTSSHSDWAIWRSGLQTSFRSLPADEAWMLDAALRGCAFGDLCAGLVPFNDEAGAAGRAASLFKTWWLDGLVTGIHFEN